MSKTADKSTKGNSIVTGFGAITAAGATAVEAYANIGKGVVNTTLTGDDFFPEPFSAPCFRVPDEWILPTGFPDVEVDPQRINRTIRLALTAIAEGLAQAGLTLSELRCRRVGIALGTTVGCTFHNEQYYLDWKEQRDPEPGPLMTYLSANLSASIQSMLQIRGPRAVITNACASGTDAIGVGRSWLLNDLCDLVIAGGADELSRIACHGFKSLMLVSGENCRPFDRQRQGLNLGEGAGIIIMEMSDRAADRGAATLGEVLGYGIGGDAHHPTAPHPDGRGLQHAVNMALQEAGVSVDGISIINAHGTGTKANDLAETGAIVSLGFEPGKVAVVSTKGATGHTLGAAGGVEAVFTLLALNQRVVHGTVGCHEPDPDFAFAPLSQAESCEPSGKLGMSQSLAFGGSNGALILAGGP